MSNVNVAAGEKLAIIGVLSPATLANSIAYSSVIDMTKFGQALGVLMLGDMASETIDFAAYTCDSDGSNPTSLKAATQRSASASANDNKQIAINVRAEDLAATSKRYIKFGAVTGGATGGPAAILALGVDPRHNPASASNLSSVVQVKL